MKQLNKLASPQYWLDTIRGAIANNLVIVPLVPSSRVLSYLANEKEQKLYLVPYDQCIPLVNDYFDPNGRDYHYDNLEKLKELRDYVKTNIDMHDDGISEYVMSFIRVEQILTTPDLCLPQNTAWSDFDGEFKPLISELFGVTCGLAGVNEPCFTRIDGELVVVASPRWRQVSVTISNDKIHEYDMPDRDDNTHDFIPCQYTNEYASYKIKLPDGVNRSVVQTRNSSYFCNVVGAKMTWTPNHGIIVADDSYTYNDRLYPSWVGHEFEGKRYVSLDHYIDVTNREVDEIRSYHRTPSCVVHRSPHYPQSKQAALLRSYTIGFEVEKRDFLLNNGEMPRSDLFRGWEYDGSCGVEGISNIYTLDNMTQFKRDCDNARFELNLPISDSCGGHINIGCENEQLTKLHLRPVAGLLYAVYKDRMRNHYCRDDKRLIADNPDRYCVIRHKRNNVTELRLASAYETDNDIIKAFELMKHVVSVADIIKMRYLKLRGIVPSTESLNWHAQLSSTPRYKRASNFDYLDKWYRQNQIPAWHSNFNGGGAQIPQITTRGVWVSDYLYLLIDSLTPWFNSYYTSDERKQIIRDAYAFHHYVLRNDASSFSTKTISHYI